MTSRKQKRGKKGVNKYYDFSKHEASHYDKYEESFGAIVVAKSYDKVLLVSSGPDNDMHWGFPKGHRNDGENNVGAAIREVKEETDVSIDMGDFILDEKGEPLTFCIEYPWRYGEDVLIYHISKVIDKQKNAPSERPYWNRTGPLKKKITLYLVPVEMDRFKIKSEDDGVSRVEWVTWEDAFKKMSKKPSNHIEALVDAFDALQKMKKIAKDKQLPKISPKLKADIKARLDNESKMLGQPINKWSKDKQPKNWEQILADMKGVSRPAEKYAKKSEESETSEASKTTKKHQDETDVESSDDASEESSDEEMPKKGGDPNGDAEKTKEQSKEMSISLTVAFIIGILLVGLVLLMFYLINGLALHSGNEAIEERVRTPVS